MQTDAETDERRAAQRSTEKQNQNWPDGEFDSLAVEVAIDLSICH